MSIIEKLHFSTHKPYTGFINYASKYADLNFR